MERWAKLFEIKGVQVMVSTGKADGYPSIDFTIPTRRGRVRLQLGCDGQDGEHRRDFMFGDITADFTEMVITHWFSNRMEDFPSELKAVFTREPDSAFYDWVKPSYKLGKFNA